MGHRHGNCVGDRLPDGGFGIVVVRSGDGGHRTLCHRGAGGDDVGAVIGTGRVLLYGGDAGVDVVLWVVQVVGLAGIVVLAAFISPYEKDRNKVRQIIPEGKFIEVYVDTDISVCEKRDPKGLYMRARKNEIKEFTGISAPYEKPSKPELCLVNNNLSDFETNIQILINLLSERKFIMKEKN